MSGKNSSVICICAVAVLCSIVDDYEGAHKRHAEMGCICYENPEMGIYFVTDPDGCAA